MRFSWCILLCMMVKIFVHARLTAAGKKSTGYKKVWYPRDEGGIILGTHGMRGPLIISFRFILIHSNYIRIFAKCKSF